MNRKKIITIFILVLVISMSLIARNFFLNKANEIEILNGIESLNDISFHEESVLLIYPSDSRVSQKMTVVREVDGEGQVLNEYHIFDDEFKRIHLYQNPTNENNIYMSTFGEPTLDNRYYMFDNSIRKIKEVKLDYFDFNVGIAHMSHYGEELLFETIASHKTGDQAYDADTHTFKVSISNFDTQVNYETEYGFAPTGESLLGTNAYIFYVTAPMSYGKGEWSKSYIACINKRDGSIIYVELGDENSYVTPLYSTNEVAYFMGEKGDLITVDNDLSLEKSTIFKGSRDEITHYTVADGLLMLNNEQGMYQVYNSNEDQYSIGLLEFGEKPNIAYILDDVILPNVKYKFLYHNETLEEIYMVGTDINNNGTLIIVNSDDFNMKKCIPIKYPHLLDLVITR